jgi:hypothetical protein
MDFSCCGTFSATAARLAKANHIPIFQWNGDSGGESAHDSSAKLADAAPNAEVHPHSADAEGRPATLGEQPTG